MPTNPKTGKTDRHKLTPAELLEFRTKQAEKLHAAKGKKGKKRARDPPETAKPKASQSVPSPMTTRSGIRRLNSKGARPPSTNAPANSSATLPQPPLFQRPALPPSKAPDTHRTPKRSAGNSAIKAPVTAPAQHSTAFTVEIPATSRHLKATHPQASCSQKKASQASDDESLAARVAAAERRQDELEKLVCEMEHKLHKLKKLGA
jgi:hypothetical protein